MNSESRLPKWAQTEISVLRMRLAEMEKRCRQIGGEDQTNVRFKMTPDGNAKELNLPKDTEVHFFPMAGWGPAFRVRLRGERLLIQGDTSYAVYPSATNWVEIQFEK